MWEAAANSLSPLDTAAASNAFLWARLGYAQYQKEWETNPSSRWDPDALTEINRVDTSLASLSSAPQVHCDLPTWATDLLHGILSADSPQDVPPFLLPLSEIAAKFRASA
jgi:hypothetical protein